MTIKAVFFDVGETLINEGRLYGAWADWLGIPPSGEHLAWKVAILFPWDAERHLFSGERVYTAGLPLAR